MKTIPRLFRRLAARVHAWEQRRREAYLASAVDIFDLEWRLREFERTARHPNLY